MNKFSFAAASLAAIASAVSTGTGYEVEDNFNVNAAYLADSGEVEFTVVIPDGTWFGIMLGGHKMSNKDDII